MINKTNIINRYRHKIPALGILCLIILYASTQTYLSSSNRNVSVSRFYVDSTLIPKKADTTKKVKQSTDSAKREPKKYKINLLGANRAGITTYTDASLLLDSVRLEHNGVLLYCDSVYLFEKSNRFEAYDNVIMNQGDTLFLYGDVMYYDGNTNKVQVRNNVRLENKSAVLYTDSLDYDRTREIGYYFNGGRLEDEENSLQSEWGQYEPNKHLAVFKHDVLLINDKFELTTDSLKYNSHTKIANLVAPSTIVSDSGTIYSSNGWYNTVTEQAVLLDQSEIISKEGNRRLKGDSILYEKQKGYGEVFGNMFLQDTLRKVILEGNYGFYNEITQYALATDSAIATEYSQGDSLYLHADTLKLIPDSTFRMMRAYHNVRFFRTDMQGVCDSMQFNSRDSVLHMYGNPILWNEGSQITGDTVDVFFNDSTIDRMYVLGYSFSIQQIDSMRFNQVKGRRMENYFTDGKISKVMVDGNVQSLFYNEEKKGIYTDLIWAEGSLLETLFDNSKFVRSKYSGETIVKVTPADAVKTSQRRLPEFYWFDYMRPLNKMDVLRKVSKRTEDIKPKRSSNFDFDKFFED